jgi:hypothetical protein
MDYLLGYRELLMWYSPDHTTECNHLQMTLLQRSMKAMIDHHPIVADFNAVCFVNARPGGLIANINFSYIAFGIHFDLLSTLQNGFAWDEGEQRDEVERWRTEE